MTTTDTNTAADLETFRGKRQPADPDAPRGVVNKVELDRERLLEAIRAKAAARGGLSMRQVCAEAGVSQNTTVRLGREGYTPDGNVLLALLIWLGATDGKASKFARKIDAAEGQ